MKLNKDGSPKHPTVHRMPIKYMYETKDGWCETDELLTKQLNNSFVIGTHKMTKEQLAGKSFYPQFREPSKEVDIDMNEDGSFKTIPAWRITPDGDVVARTRLVECEHKSWHRDCYRSGDGMCKRAILVHLRWDEKRKMWVRDC